MSGCSSDPIKILHLTDPHLFADPEGCLRGAVTRETLSTVLGHYQSSDWRADIVAMTGDVVQDDSQAAYEVFTDLLTPLDLPVYCVPGNHDVRSSMKTTLSVPPFYYCDTYEKGNWLVIGIDSCTEGTAGGLIDESELERLANALRSTAAQNVVVCLHHPPLMMNSQWLDTVGLANRDILLKLVTSSEKVRAMLFGHVHQAVCEDYCGVTIIGTPSTCRQFKPHSVEFALDDNPPAYRQIELSANGSVSTKLIWITDDD